MNRLTAHLLNEARWIYSHRKPSASALPYFFAFEKEDEFPPCKLQGEAAGEYIRKLITDDKSCMICRFGSNELTILLTYLNMLDDSSTLEKIRRYISGKSGWFWSSYAIRGMPNAGIFPADDKMLEKFSKRMLEDIKHIDILGSWLFDEQWLKEKYFPNAVRVPLPDLEPYYHENPWTEELAGKKVLVIHPYEESIQHQYKKRQLLFKDQRVLPDFELKTLKAVQSIADSPVSFSSWFEALDYMCDQVSNIPFDIAIIGAGAYGLSIASFIKQIGKKAVHFGGATQILFGIKGKKWDEMSFFQSLYNDHWIRPSISETPSNFKKVEDGVYW